MGESEKKPAEYGKIINEYIDSITSQNVIVPISYNILNAQILTESKKIQKYAKEHGQTITEDGKDGFRMKVDHSIVFDKMLTNLNYTVQAYDLVGINAVIGLVSKYDGYIGMLTKQLFMDIPEILNGSDREFKASDILTYTDFNELKDVLVEKEIETLLRKNHIEQLQWLENKLNIKKLRDFKELPDFVEIMERRNLFVHCNGVVSRQYLSECKKYGVSLPEELKVGDKLTADITYVRKSYSVLFQVGVMLGFIIWHKIKPEDSEYVIDGLCDVPYDLIRDGKYSLGLRLIDFALENKSWEKDIKYVYRLVFNINKALAYHLQDKQDECEKILKGLDLTAADPVYHLAVTVLLKDYKSAYLIMDKIGADSRMRIHYKTWPLFTRIRKEPDFIAKFKEIYKEDYECNDAKLSEFEDILNSANELVQRANKMSEGAEKVEEQEGHIVDAEIIEDVAEIDELVDSPEKSLS